MIGKKSASKAPNLSPARYAALLDRSRYRWTELWLLLLPAAFLLLGVLQLQIVQAVKTTKLQVIDQSTLPPLDAYLPTFGLIAALGVAHILLNIYAPDADQTLLPIAGTLASIGVIMATRLGPAIGVKELGSKQLVFVVIGLLLCVGTVLATRDLGWIRNFKYTWAVAGIILVGITLLRARTFDPNAPSRDVLSIGGEGGLSFQPSELLKICLVIFFAGYLSENREMLANASYRVGPFALPPLKHLGPLVVMLGIALVLFVYVRELGLALLVFGLFLSLLYVASDRPMYIVTSVIVFALASFIAFKLFPYAQSRLDTVSSAFDQHTYEKVGGSYQVVQGLVAFASGGVFGSGLGLGHPGVVPASNTDFIASSFGEEFGFAGILALIGLFMLLVYRGMHIAARARTAFNQLLAVGLTAVFALQTLVILAGNLKIMPLTGIPLPFVAYGGSALLANFIIIGLLLRLSMADA